MRPRRYERARTLTPDPSARADTGDAGTATAGTPGAVDARFTLAAERTLLAWIRTAIGFLAGGVAIIYVAPDVADTVVETTLGLVMIALGCAVTIVGAWRWQRVIAALERGGPMPGSFTVLFLVAAIVVVAVAIAVAIVLQ